MTPTVEECIANTAMLLGDTARRRFQPADLSSALQLAYQQMLSEMVRCGVSEVEAVSTVTLPAGQSSLDPSVAGIANFRQPIRVEELRGGDWIDVRYVDPLPADPPGDGTVGFYLWRQGNLNFTPVTADVQLRLTYYVSWSLADSGSVGIDDCLLTLTKLAASIAGPPKGVVALARQYRSDVFDGPTSHLQCLIQPMLRTLQRRRIQLPAYRVGGFRPRDVRAPI